MHTGQSYYSLSTSYFQIGNHRLALQHAKEALRIFQIHHLPSHLHVSSAEQLIKTLERPGRPAAPGDVNDESKAHDSAAACMLNSGGVVIKRHRGGGFASADYDLQFRLGNIFVADVKLMSGVCFYWEIEIIHNFGMLFFGLCTAGFDEKIPKTHAVGDNLGDDAWSWSVDGYGKKSCKWHADNHSPFGSSWSDGDVIGFALDMRTAGAAVLSVSVNGSFAAPNGVAFTGIDAPFLSPAFSAFGGLFRLNLGHRPFAHAVPDHIAPLTTSVHQFHQLVTIAVDDISKHQASSQLMRDSGSVVIMRHRGGGHASPDYSLHFRDFSTFVADVKLSGGCFYFEVQVVEIVTCVQFGFCSGTFEPRKHSQGEGAGDDTSSWGVCGHRQEKWHAGQNGEFGSRWCVNDVIGFALDMHNAGAASMMVSVNGSFATPNGVAFTAIDAPYLSPALSGNGTCRVNFGERPFAHLPTGPEFISVHDHMRNALDSHDATRIRAQLNLAQCSAVSADTTQCAASETAPASTAAAAGSAINAATVVP